MIVLTAIIIATVLIILCVKIKTSLLHVQPGHATNRVLSVQDLQIIIDTKSNAAYGCVGGGKASSVPAEYETPITTTVDVQSNVAYGHVSGGKIHPSSMAVYDYVSLY